MSELDVSPPAFASASTVAPELWACNRNDEKSLVLKGWRTEPTILPPDALIDADASASKA